ncbi:MAG TPA: protein-disulfide reductase DsbD domain-containing protein [Pyrinomonadaceae bacterium]|jgi:DsbC/DsbD-like thiol-disulfide interchange protein|nr:protein-disulfide reductase DsbD domain-containing protein [Pyrinomonadaceae bacterium]
MNKKISAIIFTGVLLLAGTVISASAQSISVSGSIGKGTAKRGSAIRATVVMSIPGGLHVNSSRPGSEYAIPTSVRVTVTGGKAGAVAYPRGKSRTFSFSDTPLNVYEGRIAFTFNVTVPVNFSGNTLRVRAVVRYQACTNEVCYPPTSKTVNLTARVN